MHLSCARAGSEVRRTTWCWCARQGQSISSKPNLQFHMATKGRDSLHSTGAQPRKHEVCKLWPGRGIGQECAHGDPTYTGVPGLAMRENLPQFWTTPLSEASTHATQKHWCGAQISKVTKYSTHRRTTHKARCGAQISKVNTHACCQAI